MIINGNKQIVGFTAGNFDIIHPGYVYTFQTAKKHCDYFMVFLQNDPSIDRTNKYVPVVPRAERYNTLMELESVDAVYSYQTEDELYNLIQFFKPDVRILGEDYIGKRFTGDDLPPKIIYTSRAHGWSTTRLKNDITIQTLRDNKELLFTQPELLEEIKKLKNKL
jgi:glycerol-3-phosphate cytidylyltransferase